MGYTRLRVTTHPQNQAMKALARRYRAALNFEDGETVGTIDLEPAEDDVLTGLLPLRSRSDAAFSRA